MIAFYSTKLRQYFMRYPWWGRVLGLFFGYLIAGASGALLGLIVGNFFDRGLRHHFNPVYWQYQTIEHPQVKQMLFKSIFWTLGCLAKADGYVSPLEIKAAIELMREIGLTRKQKKAAQQLFIEGKSMDPNLNPLKGILSHLRSNCERYDPKLLHFFLDIQYRMAKKDNFNLQKKIVLDKILKHLGFAPLHAQRQFNGEFVFNERIRPNQNAGSHNARSEKTSQSQYSESSNAYSHTNEKSNTYHRPFHLDAYAILGIEENATHQDVKRAYRRLISQHHPDKLMARGASESMIKIANEKTQQIRKAYEQICEGRGWS